MGQGRECGGEGRMRSFCDRIFGWERNIAPSETGLENSKVRPWMKFAFAGGQPI